jgi:hypothetical protein
VAGLRLTLATVGQAVVVGSFVDLAFFDEALVDEGRRWGRSILIA